MKDQAFQQLVLAELDAVHRLACHLSPSSQEAEDLVQETFLRAFRYASTFTTGDQGIRSWLFKILHNVIYTQSARQQREQSLVDELRHLRRTDSYDPAEKIVDCSPIDWESVDERLKIAVATLPMSFRIVFLLSAVEGLKYREIAKVTDSPLGTVMSRLSRARSLLATRLIDLGTENGFKPGQIDPSPYANRAKGDEEVEPENV